MGREFYLEYKVHFEAERCHVCSKWWARERYTSGEAACPYCKSEYYVKLADTQMQLKNQVASLKGQLTKLRKKHGEAS